MATSTGGVVRQRGRRGDNEEAWRRRRWLDDDEESVTKLARWQSGLTARTGAEDGSDQETDPNTALIPKLMWNTRGEVGSSLGGKMNAGELRVRCR